MDDDTAQFVGMLLVAGLGFGAAVAVWNDRLQPWLAARFQTLTDDPSGTLVTIGDRAITGVDLLAYAVLALTGVVLVALLRRGRARRRREEDRRKEVTR